ncbi:hypothetical protein EV385_5128 [Krasilnikovia cinnamomea]|uniref:Glycosyl hydrolase family 32 n=1 Tax=Krasilnikovia cinnamomea TaxID=349313 RepID=A0A4Q7ZQ46_9ACTN|nr:hypothetical protein [Krasilnikovia cinnamomea]RZU53228.1 hypothetical protein EV385_5128 [Krasilnikovia cinnamomea]
MVRTRAIIGFAAVPTLVLGVAATAVAAGASAGTGYVPELTEPRLVPNAGFEESATAPARWVVTGTASVVGAPVHGGDRALRTVDESGATGVSVRSQALSAGPGERLTASVWAQRGVGLAGTLELRFWRIDGRPAEVANKGRDLADVYGWQLVAVAVTVPDDAVTATVVLHTGAAAEGTTVWDDVSVRSEPAPSRQVPNAGFEELREAPAPTEWAVSGAASLVTEPVSGGRHALRTVDDSTSLEVSVRSRAVPVVPAEKVQATVQAQVLGGGAGALHLEFSRADGSTEDSWQESSDVVPVSGWQTVAVAMPVPEQAAFLTVRIGSSTAATGTTVWDEVRLRSSADVGYVPALGSGSVLFVGDQRVESTDGVTRVVHPGTKTGDPAIPGDLPGVVLPAGSWDANPRIGGTVLSGPDGRYRMWYTAADPTREPPCSYCTGYAESADGIHWDRSLHPGSVFPASPGGVVGNPRYTPADPVSARYFMLYAGGRSYFAASSPDGAAWAPLNGGQPILPGWDVGNVGYDPARGVFVAMTKQWTETAPYGPRTVWVSTSPDFVTWSPPRLAMSADVRDQDMVVAKNPADPTVLSEIYGMPAVRYGEQYLGLPWMFDITHSPTPRGDPGPDIGRSHIQLAASQDLLSWSRPARDDIITPGPAGSWDWGFQLTGTTMLTVGDQVWLYYSAFAGEHSCTAAKVAQGICTVPQGKARIGLITWPRDRFVSFRAGRGGGTLTTRPLAPTGSRLVVNVAPGEGELRAEVLTADGDPVPGYTLDDAEPVTADTLRTAVRWRAGDHLPDTGRPIRLRFSLTGGDLYSYAFT